MSEGACVGQLASPSGQAAGARDDAQRSAAERPVRRALKRFNWPLAAILAVQAGFSLSLVRSNTAYFDEAQHILNGEQEWRNLMHGTPLPTYTEAGARQIYPLIAALANSIGGLTAARILSLCFMLVASLLLYQTGVRLFGRTAALAGVALWAVSEPVLRLAFATWDPLACLLVITSLWLAVRAGVSRHKTTLVALAALALAVAGVTSLPFLIYVPVVMVVVLLVWITQMRVLRAICWALGFMLCSAGLVLVLLTVLHLWSNVELLAAYRPALGQSSFGSANGRALVTRMAWTWDGLIFVAACAAAITGVAFERSRLRWLLLAALALSALPVPLYQIHISSGIGLDKQMSAGTGMAALAAGWLVARLRPESWRPAAAWLAAGALMLYPAFTGLSNARETFRSWPDTSALTAALTPLKGASRPVLISAADGVITQYYLGGNQTHWVGYSTSLPATVREAIPSIRRGAFSAIVLLLPLFRLNSPSMLKYLNTPDALRVQTLNLMRSLPLVSAVANSGHYKLSKIIPYETTDSANEIGAWAIYRPAKGPMGKRGHRR
jgi:hypothetical protein